MRVRARGQMEPMGRGDPDRRQAQRAGGGAGIEAAVPAGGGSAGGMPASARRQECGRRAGCPEPHYFGSRAVFFLELLGRPTSWKLHIMRGKGRSNAPFYPASRTSSDRGGTVPAGRWAGKSARVAVEQMLRLHVPGFSRPLPRPLPFGETAPGFFDYLREERGLREASIELYRHNLRCFETYLADLGLNCLGEPSPSVLSGFAIESLQTHGKGPLCSHVRVSLTYHYRQGTLSRDLAENVDRPRLFWFSSVPRAISRDELRRVLEGVDRQSPTG